MPLQAQRSSRTAVGLDYRFHTVMLVCLVALLSYVAAKVGGALVIRPQMVWPLWPGCALLVGVLLLLPRKIWPILIAAGLAGFAVYDLQTGLTLRSTALLLLADTIEVLIAALGVSYSFGGFPRLNSVESLARYSVFAVILAPISTAFLGTFALGGDYWLRWRTSLFTEALALFTLTPAILSWASASREWTRKPRAYYVEAAALITGLAVFGHIAFVAPGPGSLPVLLYSLLPFLLWSALRFGLMGVSTAMIFVAFQSIWGAVQGRGPFTGSEPLSNVMSLQLFLFFAATPFMVLAVLTEENKRGEQALRESEQRFRLMADTAPALIWMSRTDKHCIYFNKPWLAFTGRSLEGELGNGWAEGVHPEDLQRCMDTYTQAFDRREEFRVEYRLRRHDGEYRWVLDIGVPRFGPDHSFVGYIGIGVDVTERKRAEEDLRQKERELSKAQRLAGVGSWNWDIQNDIATWSEELYRIAGRDPLLPAPNYKECPGLLSAESWERMQRATAATLRDGRSYELDLELVRPDGTTRWVTARGEAVSDITGRIVRLHGTTQDITERKLAEAALATVSRRLIEAQEQERTRIARELHDDIGQRLSLLSIELARLQQTPGDLPVEIRGRVGTLQKQTSEIANDTQSLSHELHSSKLEYLGVAAAMQGFCNEFGQQQKVEIDFDTHDLPKPVPPDISLCLFRVLQEALHNSAKHSGSQRFEVRLWAALDEVHLTVRDSGVGFDPEAAKTSRGIGLVSMEERVKLLNGTFSIKSQPNGGTSIHARLPLSSRRDSLRATG